MPWSKEQDNAECGPDQWAVVKDDDGSVAGCHDTEEDADAQIAALYANVDEAKAAIRQPLGRP